MAEVVSIFITTETKDGVVYRPVTAEDFIQRFAKAQAFDDYGRVLHDTITIDVLRLRAQALTNGLLDGWNTLRQYMYHQQLTVKKRWWKKTKVQRRALLLEAYGPSMQKSHRPDLYALNRMELLGPSRLKSTKEALTLPHINLEDLADRRPLLLLLDARSRSHPSNFATNDLNSMQIGLQHEALKTEHVASCVMLLTGATQRNRYGAVMSFSEHPKAAYFLAYGIGFLPGEGLLVLEMQARLITFLNKICSLILHDVLLERWDLPFGELEFSAMFEDAKNPSLAIRRLESVYGVPDQFDFGSVAGMVDAKCSEVQDHIWMLREDPSYFREELLAFSQHQRQRICSPKNVRFRALQEPSFWDATIRETLVSAYAGLRSWTLIRDRLQSLRATQHRLSDKILPGLPFPVEYTNNLARFTHLVSDASGALRRTFGSLLAGSEAFSPCFQVRNRNSKDNMYQLVAILDPTDRLWWLMQKLCGAENSRSFDLPCLLDEIERITINDKIQKARLSPVVTRYLSSLSVLTEVQRQIGLSAPGGRIVTSLANQEVDDEIERALSVGRPINMLLNSCPDLAIYGLDLERFYYPSEKRRSAKTSMHMRTAERLLDEFWLTIDRHFCLHTGKTLHQHTALRDLIQPRNLKRTPLWAETNTHKGSPVAKAEDNPMTLLAELEERTERTIDSSSQISPIASKTKVKSQNAPEPVTTASKSAYKPVSEEPPEVQQVCVSKRGLLAFSILFRVQNDDGLPNELSWSEFLHAMGSAGFRFQKLNGSAWIFEKQEGTPRKSILFHEPHPESKISPSIGRRIARRLERAFGWNRESFFRDKEYAAHESAAKAEG